MPLDHFNVPILIICRDKVSPLKELVEWLERHGYQKIVMVDNASTYPPLLEYFTRTPHEVVRLSDNLGPHKSIWSTGVIDRYAKGSYFVVTDSDVVPDSGCPGDAVAYFHWALCRFPSFAKAGFGLRIDDLPEHCDVAESARRWERKFWNLRFAGNLYKAPIDTTFALYRPDAPFTLRPAIRTGRPYLARHTPWYVDSRNLTEEDRYYRERCDPKITTWDLDGYPLTAPKRLGLLKIKVLWQAEVLFRLPKDRTVPQNYRPGGLTSQSWS